MPMTPTLFDAQWQLRAPYATDKLSEGVWRQTRAEAITRRYVQLNSSRLVWCIVVDVDHSDGDQAADLAGLPEPSWVAVNPFNNHAHVAYVLEVPVCRSELAHEKPLRFLARVEAGLTAALSGDRSYAGLLTKNPVHTSWATSWAASEGVYTLQELSCALGAHMPRQLPRSAANSHGLGRNCTMFREVREWAYRAVKRYWEDGYDDWHAMVRDYALAFNQSFPVPLPASEVDATAKSIARWVWQRFTPEQFSEIQQARSAKAAEKRRKITPELLARAEEMNQ